MAFCPSLSPPVEGIAYQVSTAILSAIPPTACRRVKVLTTSIPATKPSDARPEVIF